MIFLLRFIFINFDISEFSQAEPHLVGLRPIDPASPAGPISAFSHYFFHSRRGWRVGFLQWQKEGNDLGGLKQIAPYDPTIQTLRRTNRFWIERWSKCPASSVAADRATRHERWPSRARLRSLLSQVSDDRVYVEQPLSLGSSPACAVDGAAQEWRQMDGSICRDDDLLDPDGE